MQKIEFGLALLGQFDRRVDDLIVQHQVLILTPQHIDDRQDPSRPWVSRLGHQMYRHRTITQ
jgi:hypothetical protein